MVMNVKQNRSCRDSIDGKAHSAVKPANPTT